MDGIVFRVRQSGKVINKTIYLDVGLNREGHKELLGMWLDIMNPLPFGKAYLPT
uniref:transposase n=1 Tax=Kordia periserrulae TaxID=701523 RepID=UPI0021D374EF|nr:transposase [Kordia periserrulae]